MFRLPSFVVHNLLSFLEPWSVRIFLQSNLQLKNEYSSHISISDELYLSRTSRITFPGPCHGTESLRYKGNVDLVQAHHCSVLSGCTGEHGICHRNNIFDTYGEIHWEARKLRFAPLKCIVCGHVYVNATTTKSCFYLLCRAIAILDCYHYNGGGILYRLRDVRWLSFMSNHTMVPTYRHTLSRERRQKWINDVLPSMMQLEQQYPFIHVPQLIKTQPYLLFMERASKRIQLAELLQRCYTVLPYFERELMMLERVRSRETVGSLMNFFPDMRVSVQEEAHHRSIEFCVGIAVHQGIQEGLSKMRRIAFDVYARRHANLIGITDSYNPNVHLYQLYAAGGVQLDELPRLVRRETFQRMIRSQINRTLESKGINPRVLKCQTLLEYCKQSEGIIHITEQNVIECAKQHIIYDQLQDQSICQHLQQSRCTHFVYARL